MCTLYYENISAISLEPCDHGLLKFLFFFFFFSFFFFFEIECGILETVTK